jgi:hypothetical protein
MLNEQKTSPAVGPIASATDAEAQLRLASAQLFAVSDWLARQWRWDGRTGDWADLADDLGDAARTLALAIWIAREAHGEQVALVTPPPAPRPCGRGALMFVMLVASAWPQWTAMR